MNVENRLSQSTNEIPARTCHSVRAGIYYLEFGKCRNFVEYVKNPY